MSQALGLQADFTTGGDDLAVCQRCKASFPPGTQLFYMRDRKPDRPGKHLCTGCHNYHIQKTKAREEVASSSSALAAAENVHQQIVVAQREGMSSHAS